MNQRETRVADDRKTLTMPLNEANAYEEALNVAIDLLCNADGAHLSTRATLARLRDRIERARIGHWGRR